MKVGNDKNIFLDSSISLNIMYMTRNVMFKYYKRFMYNFTCDNTSIFASIALSSFQGTLKTAAASSGVNMGLFAVSPENLA